MAICMLTNSFSSLTANAAADSANDISNSSTSFDISPYDFLHSSAKGPAELSFAMVPTFFWARVSNLARVLKTTTTYASMFDYIEAFFCMLGILLGVLALDQNLDRYFPPFERLEVFR